MTSQRRKAENQASKVGPGHRSKATVRPHRIFRAKVKSMTISASRGRATSLAGAATDRGEKLSRREDEQGKCSTALSYVYYSNKSIEVK